MLIYRVEHKESKVGPYSSIYRSDLMSILDDHGYGDAYCDHNHPSPWDEPNLRFIMERLFIDCERENSIDRYLIFGFNSLDQLINWFYSYNEVFISFLKEKGFVINIYEVKDGDLFCYSETGIRMNIMYVEHGKKQCVFYKKVANLIDTMEL